MANALKNSVEALQPWLRGFSGRRSFQGEILTLRSFQGEICKRALTKTPFVETRWHRLQNHVIAKGSMANSNSDSTMSLEFEDIDKGLLL